MSGTFSRLCLTLVLLRSPGALGIRKTGGVFRVCLVALLLGVFVQMSMATKRGVMDNCPARGWVSIPGKNWETLFPSFFFLKRWTKVLALSLTVNKHWQPLLWNVFAWLGRVFSWMHERENKQCLKEASWKHLETKSLANWPPPPFFFFFFFLTWIALSAGLN